jgi:hypothetical protein
MEDRAQLVGIAFVQPIEIMIDYGLDGGSVMSHGLSSRLKLIQFELSHELINNATGEGEARDKP